MGLDNRKKCLYDKYMKKQLLFIGIVILLLMTFVPNQKVMAAAETTLSFSPSATNKTVGDTFTVNVEIATGANSVQALDLVFTFNKSIVEVTGVATGGLSTNFNEITKTIDNVNGKVSYSIGAKPNTTDVIKGNGTIAVITMKALAAGTSTQAWTDASIVIAALNETTSAYKSGTSGTITVGASNGAVTTTEAPIGGDSVTDINGQEIPVTGVDDWKHLITVALSFIGIGTFLLFL